MKDRPTRPAPAYQEYAADMLSNRAYRLMNLTERGLLDTMRRECWVNGSVPNNPVELAKIVNTSPQEVTAHLTERVLGFFERKDSSLTCPELDRYRQTLETRRSRQTEGGRSGGLKSSAKRRESSASSAISEATVQPNLQGKVKPLRRGDMRTVEGSKDESSEGWLSAEEEKAYLEAFSQSTEPEDYRRHSRGY